jgi:hypothetical protein
VWVKNAGLVLHLDYHTGLGAYGDYRLLIEDKKGSERERWLASHFGEGVVEGVVEEPDDPTAYRARGVMPGFFPNRLPGKRYFGMTAEFGTYDPLRVLGALRAENRAYFFAKPDSRSYCWAKQQVVEAFCPADRRWRETVVEKGVALIEQALQVCSDPGQGVPPETSAERAHVHR